MKNRLLCLFGPTAVGKTDLLHSLCDKGVEVVSVDSIQIYRELEIGSAKPSIEMLELIPHHLINILHFSQPFNVADFVRLAQEAVQDILRRGKIPLLCGGTAFYFFHFLYGFPEAPPSDPEVRQRIEHMKAEKGGEGLREILSQVDPETHSRLAPADLYRIQRALEVYYTSGRPLSSFSRKGPLRTDFNLSIIGLERPREELYRRIDQRVLDMMDRGLEAEVQALRRDGAVEIHPGMKAIGYREWFEAEKAGWKVSETVARIQQYSRNYAKRQLTFFRSLEGVIWHHPQNQEAIIKDWFG